jgi:hypothetical protein
MKRWFPAMMISVAACGSAPAPAAAPKVETASPAPDADCPDSIRTSAADQGGACLEAAVLGDSTVAACRSWLEGQGWVHDAEAEQVIGGQTGKTLVCYRAATETGAGQGPEAGGSD